jgi:glycosyltransferase involved in cell wall biosynthesis
MKIAVVTPSYQPEDAVLVQCVDSVAAQTYPCTHILASDGPPHPLIEARSLNHIRLPQAHGPGGNLPRCFGALMAINQGYDAIAFLDDDNWFTPDHIETMVELYTRSDAVVCTASRTIHRWDGSLMPVIDTWNDGVNNVDTSCLFLTRLAFPLVSNWAMMPPKLGPVCDRIYWQSIQKQATPTSHAPAPTVCFRSLYKVHYEILGEPAPRGAKSSEDVDKPIEWFNNLPDSERNYWGAALGIL